MNSKGLKAEHMKLGGKVLEVTRGAMGGTGVEGGFDLKKL